ncbi:MAG: hypothetical protein IKO46_03535 [Salinivirgaceae bacterium]|nr:hypothetical protein [Salinivirgaceae bacterium]MBR4620034.1 hypothetical protein [Salinivirgaceae bacterium]
MKKAIACMAFMSVAFGSWAQGRSSYDASMFKLNGQQAAIEPGKSINISDPFMTTRQCFTSSSRDASLLKKQGTAGVKTHVEVFYTKNEQEYQQLKSTNASESVSFLNTFSVGASQASQSLKESMQKTERLVFIATVDFGNYFYPDEPEFTPEAKALLNEGKYDEFKTRYGTHFVSGIGKTSKVTVELIRNQSEKKEQNIDEMVASMEGALGSVSGGFKVENKEEQNKNFRESGFSVVVDVEGPHLNTDSWADAIQKLSKADGDLIDAVIGFVKQQLKDCQNEADALVSRYFLTDFSLYGCKGINWNLEKEKKLGEINEDYLALCMLINMAQDAVNTNPATNPDHMIGVIVKEISQQGALIFNHDDLDAKIGGLTPEWKKVIEKSNALIPKLKKQYELFSNVANDVNDPANIIDYSAEEEEVGELFMSIFDKITEFAVEWASTIPQLGLLSVVNQSGDPFNIYLNNEFKGVVNGYGKLDLQLNVGTYQVKAVQKSGYTFYETVNYRNAVISSIGEKVEVKIGLED